MKSMLFCNVVPVIISILFRKATIAFSLSDIERLIVILTEMNVCIKHIKKVGAEAPTVLVIPKLLNSFAI